MTQDEIIEMAKQAGFMLVTEPTEGCSDWYECLTHEIEAFAKLVAAKEREHYEGILVQICVQCRSNEWGPTTYRKEILNWFHDFAANALERGET